MQQRQRCQISKMLKINPNHYLLFLYGFHICTSQKLITERPLAMKRTYTTYAKYAAADKDGKRRWNGMGLGQDARRTLLRVCAPAQKPVHKLSIINMQNFLCVWVYVRVCVFACVCVCFCACAHNEKRVEFKHQVESGRNRRLRQRHVENQKLPRTNSPESSCGRTNGSWKHTMATRWQNMRSSCTRTGNSV